MLQVALRTLGLGTPFLFAAATYALFHYVDKKASGAAKDAASDLIASKRISNEKISAIAVEIFDRLYTKPLWGWRAVARSATFTTVITLVGFWQIWPAMFWLIRVVPSEIQINWAQRLACNYVADYAALFLIRRWLLLGAARPFLASFIGPLIGVAVLLALYVLTDVLRFCIETGTFHPIYFVQGTMNWLRTFGNMDAGGSRTALLVPALVINLWLPLFVLGLLLAQLMNYFFQASGWMQWAIKRGRHHPFQAIGYVAAAVVFAVTALTKAIW